MYHLIQQLFYSMSISLYLSKFLYILLEIQGPGLSTRLRCVCTKAFAQQQNYALCSSCFDCLSWWHPVSCCLLGPMHWTNYFRKLSVTTLGSFSVLMSSLYSHRLHNLLADWSRWARELVQIRLRLWRKKPKMFCMFFSLLGIPNAFWLQLTVLIFVFQGSLIKGSLEKDYKSMYCLYASIVARFGRYRFQGCKSSIFIAL